MQKQEKSNLNLLETETLIKHVLPCHHQWPRVETSPVSQGGWGVCFADCRGGEILRNRWRCCYFIVYKTYLTCGSRWAGAAWGACIADISFRATAPFSSCQSRRSTDPPLSRLFTTCFCKGLKRGSVCTIPLSQIEHLFQLFILLIFLFSSFVWCLLASPCLLPSATCLPLLS